MVLNFNLNVELVANLVDRGAKLFKGKLILLSGKLLYKSESTGVYFPVKVSSLNP
jgi:hypothetical protein